MVILRRVVYIVRSQTSNELQLRLDLTKSGAITTSEECHRPPLHIHAVPYMLVAMGYNGVGFRVTLHKHPTRPLMV